jgi:predicted DNA-binding transcriptional regulator AlpA
MSLPLDAIWLDTAGVGQMLSKKPKEVRERIAVLPDFPKPAPIGARSKRWNAAEVQAWMLSKREPGGPGRPRES